VDRYFGFAEFVAARQMALSRTAYLLTGDHHAAQDLVQAALVKTAAHWPRVLAAGDPEAYVRRVMVNENISGWRRRVPRPVETVPDRPVADESGRTDSRLAVAAALRQLPPRQRAVVVLRFFEDLSEAETASLLGCSVGTVKSQTHDAIARLRQLLPSPTLSEVL
jgi:RNA polymerase sigma-70 factor (sigma-E family)